MNRLHRLRPRAIVGATLLALLTTSLAAAQGATAETDPHGMALIAPPKYSTDLAARIVAPYVDAETIAVVHADLARISLEAAEAFVKPVFPGTAAQLAEARSGLQQELDLLRKSHISDVYLVVSWGQQGMIPQCTVILFPCAKGSLPALGKSGVSAPPSLKVEPADPASAARLPDRPEVTEALAAAGDAAIQAILIPPASTRRVIEELLPQLPAEVGGGPSTIVTHGIAWAALAVDLSPGVAARLTLKSQDAAAADALKAKWLAAVTFAGKQNSVRRSMPAWDTIVPLLTPKRAGDRLTLTLNGSDPTMQPLMDGYRAALQRAFASRWRGQSFNHLKQLGLGMWNYYDRNKHFPPPASHSLDGKPLLSWRVALLPFLGEEKLFSQFHLDEAWDSPHNKALIETMPAVYRSPNSQAGKGMTHYLVPVGNGAVYASMKDEPQSKDITDGTSHTLMVVEVDDAHAVVWTKPDDLPFDPNDPLKGVGALHGDGFCVAQCDGAALFLKKTIDRATLKALFTRAAGDAIGEY